jgi:outer membrane protein assembly factor BamB
MFQRTSAVCLLLALSAVAEDPKPALRWMARIPGLRDGCAAVSNGEIFAPVYSGSAVVSLDATNGQERWRTTLSDTAPYPPVIDGQSVYVITGSCTLYQLSRATGKVLWSRWIAPSISSMPTLSGGRVYAMSSDTRARRPRKGGWNLICLESAKAKELWAVPVGSDIVGAPLVHNGQVVITTISGRILAFDAATGKAAWTRESTATSMAVPFGETFVACTKQGLESVRHTDGTEAWRWQGVAPETGKQASSCGLRLPMVSGNRAFVSTSPTDVSCIDLQDRTVVWAWSGGDDAPGEPVMVGGRVYLGTSKGVVHSLDAASGKTLWSLPTEAEIADAPTIMSGNLYFHDRRGGLVCVDAATPSATGWSMWGGNASHSGPVEPEGGATVVTPSAGDEE